jgi:hypothetical protein
VTSVFKLWSREGAYAWRACVVLAVLAALGSRSLLAQPRAVWTDVDHIVAIADIHGAYEELTGLLRDIGIVDDSLAWTGGNTHLVSVGDLLDRGPDSRDVMDLLMRLQQEAPASGGEVHVVLGNHELMNIIGDLRYVSDEDFAHYDDEQARALREKAFTELLASGDLPADEQLAREQFDVRFPRGFFGHRAAFAPDGRYGQWLLDLPVIIVIDDTAFVHGGLPTLVANQDLDDLNRNIHARLTDLLSVRSELAAASVFSPYDMRGDYRIASDRLDALSDDAAEPPPAPIVESLREYVSLYDSPELGINGPMWYRGSVYCRPVLERPILLAALDRLDADRVVVGHTPTEDRRSHTLLDGHIVMLDTGMLASYYGGRPTALVLEGDVPRVHYSGADGLQAIEPGRRELAYGLTRPEAEEALREGDVVSSGGESSEPTNPVTLSLDGREIRAYFLPEDRESTAEHELAAYAIDRILGFELLAPTVAREIDGESGALQLAYPDAISEQRRIEENRGYTGWCDLQSQVQLMYTWDLLLANAGRTAGNLMYRDDVSDLFLTGHANAFGTTGRLPSALQEGALSIPSGVAAAMESLNEDTLDDLAGEWLSSREQRALLSRRDELLERFASP